MKEEKYELYDDEENKMLIARSQKHKKQRLKKPYFFFFCIICVALLCFNIRISQVNGASMYPHFNNGDMLLYSRLHTGIGYGDIIIFEKNNKQYIKRVFGKPGDTIAITDNGVVLVNDSPKIFDQLLLVGTTDARDINDKLILGVDEYFVLGDNRTISLDSRNKEMGPVLKKEIKGVYLLRIK